MTPQDLFLRFGVSLAIGFAVGLQREFALGGKDRELVAGERTFALMGLTGCLAAMLADLFAAPYVFAGVLLFFAALVVAGYVAGTSLQGDLGVTTEVAMLVVVLTGALCYWGHLGLAAAVGIAATALLSLKLETDRLVRALTREDILAALQLAVISAIVLPVLPNEALLPPPFDVLNPFKIWLMVVFISGISFLGYLSIKMVGPHRGIEITGLLGGLVSSTAVTLSLTERSKHQVDLGRAFALAITIAWMVMFPRILVEVGVVNSALLVEVWPPVAAAGLAALGYCIYLFFFFSKTAEDSDTEFSNPFDLRAAIQFGVLYAVILLVARTAQMYFGTTGVYLSSILSGLVDVNAITLSVAELSRTGGLELETAGQAIILAAVSNTVVKGGIVLLGGSRLLRRAILPALALILIPALVVAFLL